MPASTTTAVAETTGPMMLSDYLRKHELGLNLLRLVLALLVIYSHAFPLGGWGPDPLWPTLTPATSFGGFAVGGFFALSGMLVTMSGMRSSVDRFLKSRFLRLVPAYFVVIVLTAAVLAPIIYVASSGAFSGYFSFSTQGPVMYVVRNLQFPFTLQFGIDNIFATTTPYGLETGLSIINGSLWTIPIEIRCYLIALLVVLVGEDLRRDADGLSARNHRLHALRRPCPSRDRPRSGTGMVALLRSGLRTGLRFPLRCSVRLGGTTAADDQGPGHRGSHGVRGRLPARWTLVPHHRAGVVGDCAAGGGPTPQRTWIARNDLSYGTYLWAFRYSRRLPSWASRRSIGSTSAGPRSSRWYSPG